MSALRVDKQGDRYLRGIRGRRARRHPLRQDAWRQHRSFTALLARRPTKVAAIALANKLASMMFSPIGDRIKPAMTSSVSGHVGVGVT